MELDTAAGTNLTAEAVGYTTVKAKVIRLEELPADAVVVILNVNPLKEGGDGHRTKWTVVRNQSLASESVYYDSELLPTFGGTFAAKTEVVSVSMESGDSMRPLRRTACSCPNCRDGANRSTASVKKEHICHFDGCNKIYGKTSHLRAHLRWHSGDKPYVCEWQTCGKRFTRSDELQRHWRTHTGEKKFVCMLCAKKFMRSDHLSKHLTTHTKLASCELASTALC